MDLFYNKAFLCPVLGQFAILAMFNLGSKKAMHNITIPQNKNKKLPQKQLDKCGSSSNSTSEMEKIKVKLMGTRHWANDRFQGDHRSRRYFLWAIYICRTPSQMDTATASLKKGRHCLFPKVLSKIIALILLQVAFKSFCSLQR